jgi:hypothetical protein
MKRIIKAVATDPTVPWDNSTRKQFVPDANAILEALIAKYGVDKALAALAEQGFNGGKSSYLYAANQLYREAKSRQSRRLAKRRRQISPNNST